MTRAAVTVSVDAANAVTVAEFGFFTAKNFDYFFRRCNFFNRDLCWFRKRFRLGALYRRGHVIGKGSGRM